MIGDAVDVGGREIERVLAGRDVARMDAAQAEGFQMPDQIALAAQGSANVRTPRR